MPSHALAEPRRVSARAALEKLERVVILGDLSSLTNEERIAYYARVTQSLGLNPLTRPFEYITLNNRLVLYARKDASDQLRQVKGISVDKVERERDDALGLAIVTVYGHDKTGRTDSAIGAVSIAGLKGEAMANALMKAETKGKRRMTLSLAGLGWLDESEIEDVVEPPRESKGLLEAIQDRTRQLADVKPNETPTYTGGPILEPDEIPGADNEDGLPDIPQPDEREGQVGLATGAETPAADIEAAGQDERDAAGGPDPLAEQRDASPATTPAQPTLEDILKATGGEVIEPEASASVEGREVGALRASGQPSRPTKDAAEAAVKARARAEAAR